VRITEVEALVLRQPQALDTGIADGSQDALVVRVHTDAGLTGIGEIDSSPVVAKAAIDAPASHSNASGLRSLLVGEDPADIERLWHRMYAGSIYFGRRGAAIHALSGLDIALWDLAGKAAGRPVHELLGGARRARVPAYASTLMPDTPDDAARVAAAQREAGFRAVKLGWGGFGSPPGVEESLVRAAREAAGEDAELMLDVGMAWAGADDAIARTRRLEPHRPAWIEEPFMPDAYADLARLAEATDVPIAAGEEESTVVDFERLMDAGAGVLQPDVTRAGGITECLRIAAAVTARGRRCVPHAWSTGIIKAATLQVLAVTEQAHWFEDCVQETELNRRLVDRRFELDADGCVAVPDGPGIGVELDEEVLAACLVERSR
jgi:L-alanine-DL-glutamate epimerase-like enolase superfamily enzyme